MFMVYWKNPNEFDGIFLKSVRYIFLSVLVLSVTLTQPKPWPHCKTFSKEQTTRRGVVKVKINKLIQLLNTFVSGNP